MPSKTRSQLAQTRHNNSSNGKSSKKGSKPTSALAKAFENFAGPPTTDATSDEGDEDVFPPAKRPSSSMRANDEGLIPERVVKRPRQLEELDLSGKSSDTHGLAHAHSLQLPQERPFTPKKPSSTGSLQSPRFNDVFAPLTPRAHSLPADGVIPHLDLSKVPPSPWRARSKSKGRDTLRIAPVAPTPAKSEVTKEADADGDVRMRDGSPDVQLLLPPSSRPPSPVTPLGISKDERIPSSPLTPIPPTPFPVQSKPGYRDLEVKVKTYDGDGEPKASSSKQLLDVPSHTKTPISTSRLPKPVFTKPSGSGTQLTLRQMFASTPTANAPRQGVKGRMKAKNSSGSNTPTTTNNTTPAPGPSKSYPKSKSQMPLVSTSEGTSLAPRTKTTTSQVTVVRLETKEPAVDNSSLVQRTPAPVADRSRSRIPAPKTPATTRLRSKSAGPSRAKTPARSRTPAEEQSLSRAHTPARPPTPPRGRTPARSQVTSVPATSRPQPPQPSEPTVPVDVPANSSIAPASRTESPLTSVPPSRSRSADVAEPLSRGRSPTPRKRVPTPETIVPAPHTPERISSPANPRTPEAPILSPENEDDEATPRELPATSVSTEVQDVLPTIATSTELGTTAEHVTQASAAEPVQSDSMSAASPSRKGKRKATSQSVGPGEVRMTRSASLRQKENKKNLDQKDKGQQVTREGSSSKAAAGVVPTVAPTTPAKPSQTPRKRAQSVSSFARPTESSAARYMASSPVKSRDAGHIHRSTTSRSLSRPPNSMFSRPPSSMTASQDSAKSSLSTLSLALEKLNAPTPSRPNTSLGFNRDLRDGLSESDADSDHDRADTAMDVDTDVQPSTALSVNGRISKAGSSKTDVAPHGRPRSATIGQPSTTGPATSSISRGAFSTKKQSSTVLMPPPPVPGVELPNGQAGPSGAVAGSSKPRINLQSGIVSGHPKGRLFFGNATSKQSIFGKLPGLDGQFRDRVKLRASKRTSLPMVEGSPVKGGGGDVMMEDAEDDDEPKKTSSEEPEQMGPAAEEPNPFIAGPSGSADTPTNGTAIGDSGATSKTPQDLWKNESRRASMAHHLLAQSLAANPMTPPRVAPATEGKGKGRAVSSTFPSNGVSDPKTAPGGLGKASGVGAHVSRSLRTTRAKTAAATTSTVASPADTPVAGTPETSAEATKSVRVLKNCVIFVDVKTEDGIDAGGLFVDMLKGMGAKVLSRVGSSCTHIVYKNGLASTSKRYRGLDDPKPLVVGIAWVVDCAERKAHVDETKYLISLDNVDIAGTNKRRKSYLPKNIMDSPERPSPGTSTNTWSHSTEQNANSSIEVTSSPASENASANSSYDHLPPLERVRRRQSALFHQP